MSRLVKKSPSSEISSSSSRLPGSFGEVAVTAWPLAVSMLSYTAMGVADTWLVGRLGTPELAAVGLATTVYFILNAMAFGLLCGAKVMVAQAYGANGNSLDGAPIGPRRGPIGAAPARAFAWQGVLLALPLGIAVGATSLWSDSIYAAMGASPRVQALASEYFVIRVWASPLWYVFLAATHAMQAAGDVKRPMHLNLVANALNIGLDIWLIYGGLGLLPMGVGGAAWATVLACAISASLGLRLFVRQFAPDASFMRAARLSWPLLRRIAAVGFPIGVRRVLEVGGFVAFSGILAHMGDAALAAHQAAFRIISISFLPGAGIGEAACILVGRYVGANDRDAARRAFRSAVGLSVAVMGVMGVAFFLWAEPLASTFVQPGAALGITVKLLWVAAFFQIADAIAMTGSGALNGAGDTRFTMLVAIGSSWGVAVPTAYTLGMVAGLGPVGVWLGMTADIFNQAVIFGYRFARGRALSRLDAPRESGAEATSPETEDSAPEEPSAESGDAFAETTDAAEESEGQGSGSRRIQAICLGA